LCVSLCTKLTCIAIRARQI